MFRMGLRFEFKEKLYPVHPVNPVSHLAPSLSGYSNLISLSGSSRDIASATCSEFRNVRHTIAEPDPLRNPPIAPAPTPALMTADNFGMSASR